MAKEIRVIKYDPLTREATEETITEWTEYAPMLGCRTFDIVGDNPLWDIYVDDEGAMINGNPVTEVKDNYSKLAGVLVFTGKSDNQGNTMSLPWEITCKKIQESCITAWRIG